LKPSLPGGEFTMKSENEIKASDIRTHSKMGLMGFAVELIENIKRFPHLHGRR
jgi:hypothetical protein